MGCGTDPSRRCDPWSYAARPRLPAIAVHMRMIVCVIAPPLSPPCPFHSMAGARSAVCADRAPTPRPPQSRLVAMCRAAHSLVRRPAPPELSLSVAWSVARSALVVVLRYEESEVLPWLKKQTGAPGGRPAPRARPMRPPSPAARPHATSALGTGSTGTALGAACAALGSTGGAGGLRLGSHSSMSISARIGMSCSLDGVIRNDPATPIARHTGLLPRVARAAWRVCGSAGSVEGGGGCGSAACLGRGR